MAEGASLLAIGAGHMGGALLEGAFKAGGVIDPARSLIIDPQPSDRIRSLEGAYGVSVATILRAPVAADAVLIAVKPQVLENVLAPIRAYLPETAVYVSIAAGKTVAAIEEQLPAGGAVVRAMPNTPAAVGKGVSGLYAASGATEAQKALAEGLLSAVGPTVWVETEDELDVLTAVSGSGPAYFFHIVEALAAAGVKAGLAPEAAGALARYTAVGAGALLEASDKPADVLRTEVTSPGGVTAAALDVLMEDRAVTRLFEKAIAAGADRTKALRDG